MKKTLTIIIAVIMMLIISLPLMAAVPETYKAVNLYGNDIIVEPPYSYQVYLVPDKTNYFVGETVFVDVMLTGNANYTMVSAEVGYDSELLQYETYTYLSGWVATVSPLAPDRVSVRSMPTSNILTGADCSRNVKIATLKFKVISGIAPCSIAISLPLALVNPPGNMTGLSTAPSSPVEIAVNNVGNEALQNNLAIFPNLFDQENNQTKPVFSNDDNRVICEEVWIELPCDTDGDGRRDLVRARFRRPVETRTHGLKTPVLAELAPDTDTFEQIGGLFGGKVDTDNEEGINNPDTRHINYEDIRYSGPRYKDLLMEGKGHMSNDLSKYSVPAARVPVDSQREGAPTTGWNPTDWLACFIPLGYICASLDMLGSTYGEGFPTCGSYEENLCAAALVDWLNGRVNGYTNPYDNILVEPPYWATGEVAMCGETLPLAAAVTGVEGLKTIVAISPVASSYELYRANGGVYAPGGKQGWDATADIANNFGRGFAANGDTPLSPVHPSPDIWNRFWEYLWETYQKQDRVTGDYNAWWDVRNKTAFGDDIRKDLGMVLMHGLNDDEVRFKHTAMIYETAKQYGITAKGIFHQGGHTDVTNHDGLNFYNDIHKWFDHYLYGVINGMPDNFPNVRVQSNVDISWKEYDTWPKGEYQRFYPTISWNIISPIRVGLLSTSYSNNAMMINARFKDTLLLDLKRDNPDSITTHVFLSNLLEKSAKFSGYVNGMQDDQFYRWRNVLLGGSDGISDGSSANNNLYNWTPFWTAPSNMDYEINITYLLGKEIPDRVIYVMDAIEEITISGTVKITAWVASDMKTGSISAMLVDFGSEHRHDSSTSSIGAVTLPNGTESNSVSWAQMATTSQARIIACGSVDIQNLSFFDSSNDSKIWHECFGTNWMASNTYQTTDITLSTPYLYSWEMGVIEYTVLRDHKLVLIIYSSNPEFTTRPNDPAEFTVVIDSSRTFISLPLLTPYPRIVVRPPTNYTQY
ncbi:MAG: hypothetical protein FWG43_04160 [Clostridiales bacterium]|nr:hypothetical protein [Clostridiales bacterium]